MADRRVDQAVDMYYQSKSSLKQTTVDVHDKVTSESYKLLNVWLPSQDENESTETSPVDSDADKTLENFPRVLTKRLKQVAFQKVSQARLRSEEAVAKIVPVDLLEYSKALETQSRDILDQFQGQIQPYSDEMLKVSTAAVEDLNKLRTCVQQSVTDAAIFGKNSAVTIVGDKMEILKIEAASFWKVVDEK